MHLTTDGQMFSIGQLGPNFLLLRHPVDHPPVTAILFLSIDGLEREWQVSLPEGISASSRRVAITKAAKS
ncbi:MAG TPA: hypothetical protein VK961_18400 [Chthoniobacter sp.]|nr:hypothetical protein [Chthoniobacter sp.]